MFAVARPGSFVKPSPQVQVVLISFNCFILSFHSLAATQMASRIVLVLALVLALALVAARSVRTCVSVLW
jgi:hypothetical protein